MTLPTDWAETIFENFCNGRIEDFYKYLYPDILVYASSLSGGSDAAYAEDWVQDAVEKAYLRRNEFVSATQWKAFIIACVRNKAISFHRHSSARDNYLSDIETQSFITPDVMADYIAVETRTRLFNAIATLPEALQQIFNLSFEEGLRNPEIAARIGVAEITVKKRKAKLITRLRGILGDSPELLLAIIILS